ncbi:MAG: AAA family ATPase, partial [Planctomycetota bacterium]|nr:AAA family ATPase [Planctomycetota bacterium]
MRLVRLEIRRLPGIDVPFTLGEAELGSGLNVIHGPNGVGKSSVVRAVRAVLWPTLVPNEGLEIEAQFHAGDVRWHVRREGSFVRWTRNGEASAAPELPSADLARSFLVGIEELARADAADFEGEIRRQMSGGIDFDALVAEHRWHDNSARGPRRELDAARRETQEIRSEQETLQTQVDEREELKGQREEAERQGAELPIVEALLELRAARATLELLRARRDGLPSGMERLRGDELQRLTKLRERETKLQQALRESTGAEQRERQQLTKLDLAQVPTEAQLGELTAARDRWARADARHQDASRALANRELACEAARAACPGNLSEQALVRSDLLAALDLDRLLRDTQQLEADAAALEAELALLPDATATKDAEKLPAALAALRSWLNAPEPVAQAAAQGNGALLPIALLALAVLALGFFVHPLSFAGLIVVAALAWRARGGTAAAPTNSRAAFESQFDALGLGRVEWSRASVEARFNELDERRRKADDERAAGTRRAELRRKRELLRPREADLAARREALRQSLGLETGSGAFELATFASAVASFRQASRERAGAEGEQRLAAEERDAAAEKFRALLAPYSKARVEDALEAAQLFTSLSSRASLATAAQRGLERALDDRAKAERELADLKEEQARFWKELALDAGDERGLQQRLEALATWMGLQKDLDHGVRQAEALARKLGARQSEAEASETELQRRLESARQAKSHKDELIGQLAALDKSLETARNQRRFEKAVAEETRCRLELERELA